ncbi:unnamed protein product [Prunus armeniaca]
MKTPKTQKDIQSLIGRVAALTRFISKATDKCVPFFKALKGGKHHIAWTPECDQAFQDLKNYMSKAPPLSKPLANNASLNTTTPGSDPARSESEIGSCEKSLWQLARSSASSDRGLIGSETSMERLLVILGT